jgi:sugar lactone lactonase YvrE
MIAGMSLKLEPLVEGLRFPEGPRWRGGLLYFADMHAQQIMTTDLSGKTQVVARLEGDEPSGIGWLPDGRMLVVSMQRRKLLRFEDGHFSVAADLSPFASFNCNDMVVDGQGRAYVGNLGSDVNHGAALVPAALILVPPGGAPRVAARDLHVPNGCVVTPDGGTLIVAESFGHRLSAFQIEADGSLSQRRVWAELPGTVPDGICLDAEGGIWVASPLAGEVLRVLEGGKVTHRTATGRLVLAPMLGGPDGRTLFVLSAQSAEVARAGPASEQRTGRIDIARADAPRAGWP